MCAEPVLKKQYSSYTQSQPAWACCRADPLTHFLPHAPVHCQGEPLEEKNESQKEGEIRGLKKEKVTARRMKKLSKDRW